MSDHSISPRREVTGHEMQRHQAEVRKLNTAKGWYDEKVPFLQAMALLLTEVNEAHDASHSEGHQAFGAELADIYIRLLDDCERYGVDLVTATDIYRFPVRATTGLIDTDLWFLIAPIVNAIEAYRVHGVDLDDRVRTRDQALLCADLPQPRSGLPELLGGPRQGAFDTKMVKNWTRPYRHGGKHA